MMRMVYVVILLLIGGNGWMAAQTKVVATGQGADKAQAITDALRRAVEQGAGVKIFSETLVKDFVALQDLIVTESFGLVTSYQVLETRSVDKEIWEARIEAMVSRQISRDWAKLKIILEQKGRPTVMLAIREQLDNQELTDLYGESAMADKLSQLGFEVINRQMFEDTQNLQKECVDLERNWAREVAVAASHGVDLLVMGILEGRLQGITDVYGLEYVVYTYFLRAKIVRTDTGQEVASLSEEYPYQRNALFANRENTARAGLKELAQQKCVKELVQKLLTTWIRDLQEGTVVHLTVSQVKFAQRMSILAQLKALPEFISSVQVQRYHEEQLVLNIKSRLPIFELAEKLEQIPGMLLEVTELSKNQIQVTYVSGP